MSYMNGKSAELIVKLVVGLLGLLIVCITAIIVSGHEVPNEWKGILPSAITGLIGVLVGTRIVTPDVSAQIKTEDLDESEIKVLTDAKPSS